MRDKSNNRLIYKVYGGSQDSPIKGRGKPRPQGPSGKHI